MKEEIGDGRGGGSGGNDCFGERWPWLWYDGRWWRQLDLREKKVRYSLGEKWG